MCHIRLLFIINDTSLKTFISSCIVNFLSWGWQPPLSFVCWRRGRKPTRSRPKSKRECSVIEFDGKEVTDPSSLRNSVAGTPPGRKVTLKIMRDGKMQKIDITIAELPSEMQKLQGKFDNLLKGVMVQGLLFLDTFLQIKYNKNFRTL